MVATTMKSPQPFLDELQQKHENASTRMMLESRSSFGKRRGEEVPLARGVKLQDGRAPPESVNRPSLTMDDLTAAPSMMMNDHRQPQHHRHPLMASKPLPGVSTKQRQESSSSDDFDGSVLSDDDSSSEMLSSMAFDSSDSSLLSPSKLYGRDCAVTALSEAYRRIIRRKSPAEKLEFVLISGGVGSGKTAMGESTLRRLVAADGGFFCYGKFDQYGMTHPLSPLCAAFSDFVSQVEERDESVKSEIQHKIRAAVDGDLSAIYKMIPPLAALMDMPVICDKIGEDSKSPDHKPQQQQQQQQGTQKQQQQQQQQQKRNNTDKRDCSSKAKGHGVFAIQRLMRAISTPDRPVVMMFDDLQWALRAPLDKIKGMATDDLNDGIMFVGVSQNDVAATSPLSTMLRGLEDSLVGITQIRLQNLGATAITDMVDDSFVLPEEQANALAGYILEHTAGNPYLVKESLRAIRNTPGMLEYDTKSETWMTRMEACCNTGCCPVNWVESKLRVMPRDMQKVFMVASCLGNNITPRLVEIALQEDVDERFDKLVKKGKFTFDKSRQAYSFRQNAVQEASYRLIDESIRPGFHLEIGLRLWRYLEPSEVYDNIFIIVDQIRRGVSLIDDQALKYKLTGLVIESAKKAAEAFNFQCAAERSRFAFTLLGKNHWEEAYDLSLILYNYAAEIEFASADSNLVDQHLDAVLENARNFSDQIAAYSTRVYVLGGRGKMSEAIETGMCVLEKLGVHLPKSCHKINTALAMGRISRRLKRMSNERIRRKSQMTDPDKLAAMQILNLLFLNTNLSRADLFPHVVLKMMKLTLNHGLSALSSVAFAGYGSLLCFAGNVNEGLRFGNLALNIVDDFNAVAFKSRCAALVWGTIFPHVRPWVDSLDQLKEGHRVGLQTGDNEFAMLNAHLYVLFMADAGSFTVNEMIATISKIVELTELHGHTQQVEIGILKPLMAAFERLADPNGSLLEPCGLDEGIQTARDSGNQFVSSVLSVTQELLHYVAGDHASALKSIDQRDVRMDGCIHETFDYNIQALVSFAEIRGEKSRSERRRLLKRAKGCMNSLKSLSRNNPANCLAKCMLLEAEEAAMNKKYPIARERYANAISLARSRGSLLEVAIANQAAATHFLEDRHDIYSALDHFKAAREAYAAWGAHAAATLLTKRIDELSKHQV